MNFIARKTLKLRTIQHYFLRQPLCRETSQYPSNVLRSKLPHGCQFQTLRCLYYSPQLHAKDDDHKSPEKVGIVKKFKQMSKDYWYVLIPVHVATSIVWFGGFYVMCKSGVDVGAILQACGVSESYVEKLSNSDTGYYALAYACYKVATPARYTVTVGGTTMTVKYLSDFGYLKTSTQVAEDLKEKADNIKQDVKDKKNELKEKSDKAREEWKERSERVKDEWKERSDKAKEEWTDAWHKFGKKKR